MKSDEDRSDLLQSFLRHRNIFYSSHFTQAAISAGGHAAPRSATLSTPDRSSNELSTAQEHRQPCSAPAVHDEALENKDAAMYIQSCRDPGFQAMCRICGWRFSRQWHGIDHVRRVHFGARNFRCDECGSLYKQKGSLQKHKRRRHPSRAVNSRLNVAPANRSQKLSSKPGRTSQL
mmetsp:Transcript_4243/g.11634  ORF Transcript_4243/g.11634 Transcript_4243/m.11634 type:complete len:176 (-) Transcript_4243:83-610(-)